MTSEMMENYRSDRNGYRPSILQTGNYCWLCGRTDRKLDRHEVFGGAYRAKSKYDGLWLLLCHDPCHIGKDGAHKNQRVNRYLKAYAQGKAQEVYGWSTQEFIMRYGKNWR